MDLSGMPKTVEEWIWWVNLVFTILMILTGAAGALTLKKSGCLGTVFKAMWLPLILFAITQMVTIFGPAFIKDQPKKKEEVVIVCSDKAELAACEAMVNDADPPVRQCTWKGEDEVVEDLTADPPVIGVAAVAPRCVAGWTTPA